VTAKPRKPWRVTVTGPDVHAESSHTTEAKVYEQVRGAFGSDDPADSAKVEKWEDGRWLWYETVTADEIAPHRTTET
jgi:hypothetical protein